VRKERRRMRGGGEKVKARGRWEQGKRRRQEGRKTGVKEGETTTEKKKWDGKKKKKKEGGDGMKDKAME
jgi:hypothetical protein